MKKLSMFCVLVLACVGAKAAVVDWSVSGTVSTVGYQVYLVGALSDTWTSVADIAADAATFGTKGTSGTVAKAGRIYTTGSQSLVSDSVTKTSGDVYFLIVTGNDATTYNYVKVDLSGYTYEGVESPPAPYDTTTDALLAGMSKSFSGGSGSIPEPTSGLLLLVGGAMLALRRRRA